MCHGILDEAGCDAGAGGDHGLETAVVHHEVTHFADVPLLYKPPEHVAAVMTVGGLVERFLAEAVPVAGWGLG